MVGSPWQAPCDPHPWWKKESLVSVFGFILITLECSVRVHCIQIYPPPIYRLWESVYMHIGTPRRIIIKKKN